MRTETTDLVAFFKKSNGGRHTWRYKEVDTSLPAADIKEACELLTTLDLFEQDGVKLFDAALSAKFVTTIETWIFDVEHDVEETPPEAEQPIEPTCEDVRCFDVPEEETKEDTQAKLLDAPFMYPRLTQGQHYERLTQVQPLETTDSAIKVTTDSLPTQQVEIIGNECPQQELDAEHPTPEPDTKKGLFHRIFRRRSRNKEAPDNTPRE